MAIDGMLRSNATNFSFNGTAYVRGEASGRLVASPTLLSFWGGVNPETGEVIDRHHDLSGQCIHDVILAVPGGRGSCTGSGVILQLLLNNKAPKALVFERREEILTLGVMVAEEMFQKSIPVVRLERKDFRDLIKRSGDLVHVLGGHISTTKSNATGATMDEVDQESALKLSQMDRVLLKGEHGEAARMAMRIVARMADLLGASELMDISQVHVDACVYTGPACLAFAERLKDSGGKVVVPTSLNSISIDQRRWRAQGVETNFGEASARLAEAYVAMGAQPTFTCAPYQLATAPKIGEQVAWGESNAVVYANSVLGARTMKYPDFLDICIALTGRAPKAGPHIDINRQASLIVNVSGLDAIPALDDSFFPLLGYHIGSLALSDIPVIDGLKTLSPGKDDLKAFGAAFATTSSAPMFHMIGVTPEATSIEAVTRLEVKAFIDSTVLAVADLELSWNILNSAPAEMHIDLISLGNPHFSSSEIKKLAELCRGRTKRGDVAVVVTCSRSTYGLASQAGLVNELLSFGIDFMTDTCWCMITHPTIKPSKNAIMTNSGKYAHYGPGLTGRLFRFGSLSDCVEAACVGAETLRGPSWLSQTVA